MPTAEILLGLLGIGGAVVGWIEIVSLPRRSRQEILDGLREQAPEGVFNRSDLSWKERVDRVVSSGMSPADPEARFARPRRHLWRAIRALYRERKIDVMFIEGQIDSGPTGTIGKKAILPIFVRGLLPPDLRRDERRVEDLLSHLGR